MHQADCTIMLVVIATDKNRRCRIADTDILHLASGIRHSDVMLPDAQKVSAILHRT